MQQENTISKLSKSELLEFVKLNQKVKSKMVGIRLTIDEHERYEALAKKHGQPLSSLVRKSLFSNLFHFKGIKED